MKAAVFYSKSNLVIEEIILDHLQDDEVMVDVKSCGICGTDVHIYEGATGSVSVKAPVIIGHEIAGIVSQIGTKVSHIKIGDIVAVNPNDMCGYCASCLMGTPAFCSNHHAIGTIEHGGFAEQIKVRAKQVHKCTEVDLDSVAMIEPLSCCLNAFEIMHTKIGDTCLIIGAGPIGLMMIQLARIAGASKIIVSELNPHKREMAILCGADITYNPNENDIKKIKTELQIHKINKILECVGLKETQEYSIHISDKGTEVMFFGLGDPEEKISIKPFELFSKQISLLSCFINPNTFEKAVFMVQHKMIDFSHIISHHINLEELASTLADPKKRSQGKVIVHI